MRTLSVSRGNDKMGAIPSVSLPAIITCRKCGCNGLCYATKGTFRFPVVVEAFQNNLALLHEDPNGYWAQVEVAIAKAKYFRFHVSGDIPTSDYFMRMNQVARKHQGCEIVCFTKKYELVNAYLDAGHRIPKNLHVIFSKWTGLNMPNPHNLPESHVLLKDGTCTADVKRSVPCGGHCLACAKQHIGCFNAQKGQQIVLIEH